MSPAFHQRGLAILLLQAAHVVDLLVLELYDLYFDVFLLLFILLLADELLDLPFVLLNQGFRSHKPS